MFGIDQHEVLIANFIFRSSVVVSKLFKYRLFESLKISNSCSERILYSGRMRKIFVNKSQELFRRLGRKGREGGGIDTSVTVIINTSTSVMTTNHLAERN